jgi:hypothetical protein
MPRYSSDQQPGRGKKTTAETLADMGASWLCLCFDSGWISDQLLLRVIVSAM